MTEYVLDIKTISKDHLVLHGGDDCRTEYFFTIDINGNVNIAIRQVPQSHHNPHTEQFQKKNIVSINDNIPIPKYFINIIKELIEGPSSQENLSVHHHFRSKYMVIQPWGSNINCLSPFYQKYWTIVIGIIIKIKEELRELVENPQDNLDIKTQLDTYIVKTNLQQQHILELETKVDNIQTAYFDILNNNKYLKELIKSNENKQTELQIENEKLLRELNNMKQLDETRKYEQQKMEELEKERLWKEYKLQKQNYNPLYR
jgi:hypothetical protein